jgi:HD superfamily phosphohydrolase
MLEAIHDPIYGVIELPATARKLATTCPLLLRLREVRMPNTPFITFPGFAGVSRYEHSVGVAHLAWWWSRQSGLSDWEAEALTLGALYHDAATPAFSHLFEEFLSRNDFDHEDALADVLSARPSVDGGAHSQVFLGRSAVLREELAKRPPDEPIITATDVASIATGMGPLGPLINGEIDLDNIDNVIRAVSAMGISGRLAVHPYEIASAIVLDGGTVQLARSGRPAVQRWQALRRLLYRSILESQQEFLTQATIKWAIEECYVKDERLHDADAWCLTESELIFEHLRRYPRSRTLIDRVRLARPAPLLFSAWLGDLRPLVGRGSERATADLCTALAEIWGVDVYVSLVRDKRERQIRLPLAEPQSLLDIGMMESNEDGPGDVSGGQTGSWGGLLGAVGLRLDDDTRYVARRPGAELLSQTRDVLDHLLGVQIAELKATWIGVGGHGEDI